MRLYLDDDLDGNVLIGLLQYAGHEVVSPRAVGTWSAVEPRRPFHKLLTALSG